MGEEIKTGFRELKGAIRASTIMLIDGYIEERIRSDKVMLGVFRDLAEFTARLVDNAEVETRKGGDDDE